MRVTLLVPIVLMSVLPVTTYAGNPGVLWKIVHERCVPNQRAHKNPSPCASVDLSHGETSGTAILKDIRGATQYLLVPTAQVSGIETPAIVTFDAPNYFAAAWTATALIDDRLHHVLPRQDFALAINSEERRSQNQLHIHVDCIRAEIRVALDQVMNRIGPHWQDLPIHLATHRYRALWVPGASLDNTNPFRLLAASLTSPATEMRHHSLVLVGAIRDGKPGFILLDGISNPLSKAPDPKSRLGSGSGEELEDHACQIASQMN